MNARKLLQDHGISVSDLRVQMIEILARARAPLSFESFSLDANKTTFYRNMELFEKEGIVVKTELDRKGFYELADRVRAYFVCEVCHEFQNIQMPKLDGKIKSVLVKGVCQKCDEE
ncbi:transcriptional repressor [Helicobacter pametensis]|uniref:transcriptional repressor n=1 Tax=Helicobacter pametensis TaxID=95149 RepID=UPI000482ED95|nr:transcriptional repressor [Helicobacter pametensis]